MFTLIKYDYHKAILGYFTHITTCYCVEIHQSPHIDVLNHVHMLSYVTTSHCVKVV